MSAVTSIRSKLALSTLTTDVWLLLSALHRKIAELLPGTGLEGYFYITLIGWLTNRLRRLLPNVNPFPKLYSLTYFTSIHSANDASYQWIGSYWESQEKYKSLRQVITATGIRPELANPSAFLEYKTPEAIEAKQRISPSFSAATGRSCMRVWWRRTLLVIEGTTVQSDYSKGTYYANGISIPGFELRCFARDRTVLLLFLDHIKTLYETRLPPTITMKAFKEIPGYWEYISDRTKRNWKDIIIPEAIKNKLKTGISEFIENQNWYGDRGLAWKTGIMLYGPPGCGKTSTVIGLASHFDLPVYILPLTSDAMRDSIATSAVRNIPPRAIILLEDVDAWSRTRARRLRYDEESDSDSEGEAGPEGEKRTSTGHPMPNGNGKGSRQPRAAAPPPPNVSLSCLLSILDGVEAVDGKIIICTTNALDSLDPALIRPGRIDLFAEFKKATRTVAEELFISFYRPYSKGGAQEKTHENLEERATAWAGCVEDGEFSLAQLQGMLLSHKKTPKTAVEGMEEWVKVAREGSAGQKKAI